MKKFIILVVLLSLFTVSSSAQYLNDQVIKEEFNKFYSDTKNYLFVNANKANNYSETGSVLFPYDTIDEAITEAASLTGDSLIVAFPGTYAETVTIASGDTLLSFNATITSVTGNHVDFSDGDITASGSISGTGGASFSSDLVLENGETIGNSVDDVIDLTAGTTTFSGGIDVEGATGVTLENDETITNSVDGTVAINGIVSLGGNLSLENGETLSNSNDGTIEVNGGFSTPNCTIAADATTPDATGCYWMTTSANTGATAITNLANAIAGSTICLVGGSATNSSTVADSGNFNLTAAFTAGLDDVLCLYVQGTDDFIEISRADN